MVQKSLCLFVRNRMKHAIPKNNMNQHTRKKSVLTYHYIRLTSFHNPQDLVMKLGRWVNIIFPVQHDVQFAGSKPFQYISLALLRLERHIYCSSLVLLPLKFPNLFCSFLIRSQMTSSGKENQRQHNNGVKMNFTSMPSMLQISIGE